MPVAEMKIYEPRETEELPLPESVLWDTILEKPESLKDLDKTASASLEDAIGTIGDLGDLAFEDLVTQLQLADEAVTNAKIAVDAIQGDVIAAGAITNTKISDDAISTAKLQAGAIVASKIAAGTITANEIAASTITAAKMNVSQLSAIAADLGSITAGTITGATIQTGTSGKRLRMQGSPANEYQFLDGATKVGHLKIDDDGAGGYYAEIDIEEVGALRFGTEIGVAENIFFEVPFFHASGRAATGEVIMGRDDFAVGLGWAGGGDPTWSFFMGTDAIVLIDSDMKPATNNAYDLGSSSLRWKALHVNSITLNGVTKTTFAPAWGDITGTISSQSDLNTALSGKAATNLNNLASVSINATLGLAADNTYNIGGNSGRRISTMYLRELLLTGGGFVNDARAIYMETGQTTNPSVSGEIRYYDGASKGLRLYVNGFLGQFDLSSP